MVRELDFSKITLRIIEHIDKDGDGDEDHIIAKLTGNTIDTLRRCLVCCHFLPPICSSFQLTVSVHTDTARIEGQAWP